MTNNTKYRGFSNELNKWVYRCYFESKVDTPTIVRQCGERVGVDKTSVGELINYYTVDKFKNNKIVTPVFEGDILACDYDYDYDDDDKPYIVEVHKRGVIEVLHSDFDTTFLDWALDTVFYGLQVVGNVFQNPELLTKEEVT